MKELLLYMAKNLVDDPDSVTVTETENEKGKVLQLHVADGDMGKVIGRQGRIAKEIRTIIRTVSQRTGERVTVEIVDNEEVDADDEEDIGSEETEETEENEDPA